MLESLQNLHSPLRGEALDFITPALTLLEEIQETGDIFFPRRWLDATLGRHSSSDAAQMIKIYIENNPALSAQLESKVLQSGDLLLRRHSNK